MLTGLMNLFLLRHAHVGSEFGLKSMDPNWLVSTVQVGGVMRSTLIPNEHHLNVTAFLSIVTDNVHPFMNTIYLSIMVTFNVIIWHVTKYKCIKVSGLPITRSESNTAPLGGKIGGLQDE